MPQLTLFLLGSPRLERDGQPVEVDTRKAIALMAYLAVTRQSHSRDALATLLWPDYDQTHARGALRRTLSALNKALAGEWLEVDRETIGLRPEANIWLDVAEFQRRLAACRSHDHPVDTICPDCLTPLTEAAALYRDDFLAGFTLRDSPDFDEWQYFQSESLRRELAGALESLVRCHTLNHQFDQAITYARRWLALDPLHEQAHRELMRLFAWAGERGAALRQYRECVRIMDQELGVPPLDETTQLYTAIQENRLPTPPTPTPGESPAPVPLAVTTVPAARPRSFDYPLVGRAAEWAALLNACAASSQGHVVILQGEAGIGKTRLAEEFLAHAQAQGSVTLTARCYAGETNLAYSLFIEGLRSALSQSHLAAQLAEAPDHWLSEAVRLLPELATLRPGLPAAPPLDSPGAQSRFFEGILQLLLALCRGPQPGVILFDDLHWADAASLDLLTYLVRRLRGRPLCLIFTWRSESAVPRLQQLLTEAQRAGPVTLLTLPRLNQTAVAELVSEIAPGLESRLYAETEGLPFFLVEYLIVLAKGGESIGGDDWTMPGGVRGLLQSRLAGVSETGWQLLTTAAVIGRSFDFDTLRAASGRSDEEIVTALEALIEQGLVAEVNGSGDRSLTYDFSHEKLRTLVYEEASLTRRRLLHRRVAEALIGRTRGRQDLGALAGQIAYHYRRTGQDGEAAEYFKLAGEHARSLYANAEALAHFQAALALGHPEAAVLHEAIGDLHTLLGEYSAALTSYETAAALLENASAQAKPGGDETNIASSPPRLSASASARIEHKLGNVHHRRGEWELAESYFQAALAAEKESGQPGESARLYADWSLTAHHHGQATKALNLAQRARELAESAGDTQALAQVHNILGILARSQSDSDLACQHLEQSLAMAEALGDPTARIAALNNLALACSASNRIERAITLTETALALCVSQGDRHREAALHNNLADLFHAAGQTEPAMAHLKQAVTIFAEIGAETGAPQPEIWKLVEW
ncbi:MAG: AAA family ATPase [Anaerolineae bacterium]|nr:AAA family ATPase [Anaerolineales bacterium]